MPQAKRGSADTSASNRELLSEPRVLRLISEQTAIPVDLLTALLETDKEAVTQLLEEFASSEWVRTRRFFVNDESWVWLTDAGAERAGTGIPAASPVPSQLPHLRALTQVRLSLQAEHPQGTWLPDQSPGGDTAEARPIGDAVFAVPNAGNGERWAVEVDHPAARKQGRAETVSHLCDSHDRVLWFCTPDDARALKSVREFQDRKVILIESPWAAGDVENFRWQLSSKSAPAPSGNEAELSEPWEAEVVRLLADQEAMPLDQLSRFLGCDSEMAQWVADQLQTAGLAQQAFGPVGEGPWLWATEDGCRLAGATGEHRIPSLVDSETLRFVNEARLRAHELFPGSRWLSKRRLLEAGAPVIPIGLLRDDQREYAVEMEPTPVDNASLVEKYVRRRTQHRSERRDVLVLCCSDNAAGLEALQAEREWGDFHIHDCPAFERAPGSGPLASLRLNPWEKPLLRIDVGDLPQEAVQAVQEAEGATNPPPISAVGKRQGGGCPRWRVTTERNVWRVTWSPAVGWRIRPADIEEMFQELTSAGPPDIARHESAPLVQIDVAELPQEALDAIQEAEGSASPPRVTLVGKRNAPLFARYRVSTTRDVWRVVRSVYGWHVHLADEKEIEEDISVRSLPELKHQNLVQIDVADLPQEALDAIQEAEGSASPPRVTLVGKRRGGGVPRWRVTTDRNVWRVSRNIRGWYVWPADEAERARKLLSPLAATGRDAPLVQIDVADLPQEALDAIQEAEGSASPPRVTLVGKRKGSGVQRFRVTTRRDVWRVSRSFLGWRAVPADRHERKQELLPVEVSYRRPRLRPLQEIDVADVPQDALEAVRKAEGAPSPPKVTVAGRCTGNGSARLRLTTADQVWRVGRSPAGWVARPANENERSQQLEPRRAGTRNDRPLVEVDAGALPEEALRVIQNAEGYGAAPELTLVAKRMGSGSQCFRVTTDREVWRLGLNQLGWHAKRAGAEERAEEVLAPKREGSTESPLVEVDATELPEDALRAVQEAEGGKVPPKVELVGKRKGRPFARFRVTTRSHVWRVARTVGGWHVKAADKNEVAEKLIPRQAPSGNSVPLLRVAVKKVPQGVLEAVARAEGTPIPLVTAAAKRRGTGLPRFRITTESNVWRVTRTEHGWRARPSDQCEKAAPALPPPRK